MPPTKAASRVVPHGKFFSQIGRKFFLKATRIAEVGSAPDFQQKLELSQRFSEMVQAHTTGLILTDRQAESLIGVAAQSGLQVFVEVSVTANELLSDGSFRSLSSRISHLVGMLRGYPSLMGYLIDCRVDPDDLRHRGVENLRKRLGRLIAGVREVDPGRMIAVKHRPATLALASHNEDLVYAELPVLAPAELSPYIVRLHNLAEARPLVLEFGGDVERPAEQDELIASAFGLGAAGVVVAPALRRAASPDWTGLRAPNGTEIMPFAVLSGSCPPQPQAPPMVSVVICAYNADRTMRACLKSLREIDYPNYEVVIVDDGSRDRTAEISAEFPEFRLIRQPNKGLSIARNVGMQAARGELVAYTDSDCVVDPHWLTLMVRAMVRSGFDGCGGPNYAPHEDGWVEGAVAASPGAPCHVLTADDRAEHLAGCNMVFRRTALLELGGFDPQFTAAGDDVDICWRMLDAGFTLGFCPSAFVWHFRRNTVKAYYGQQRGYGKAEAMLFLKYPERFNGLGQIRWRGTIPGLARTFPGRVRSRIGWSRRARDLQRVSEAPLSVLKVIPMTAEWNVGWAIALALSIGFNVNLAPTLAMLALGPIWALYYALRAPLEKCHRGLRARALISWLAYTGPMSRTLARYRFRRNARRPATIDNAPRQRPTIAWLRRSVRLAYWNEAWTTREALLERINRLQAKVGRPAVPDVGWSDADLTLEPGALTRVEIKTADEEHSGNRMKNHVAIRARLMPMTRGALWLSTLAAGMAAIAGYTVTAITCGAVAVGLTACSAAEVIAAIRMAYLVVEQSAGELGLAPLGRPTAIARAAVVRSGVLQPQKVRVTQPRSEQ